MIDHKLLLITGYSGAGLSSVLKTLEDLGFEVFDNFPLPLLHNLVEHPNKDNKPIAIGIDARTRGFDASTIMAFVKDNKAELIFITCEPHELQRRFSETRRRHPMAGGKSVKSGIKAEETILGDLQHGADIAIDTTDLSIHDLRHVLEGHFLSDRAKTLNITLMSFGFKHGLPREADIVMDVRFLKNPHWDPDLKPLTGMDKAVGKFIAQDPDYEAFLSNLKSLIHPLLPRYKKEGKAYLTIAVGCTGGRHRSVHMIETLGAWLKDDGLNPHIEHRDLNN